MYSTEFLQQLRVLREELEETNKLFKYFSLCKLLMDFKTNENFIYK